jgi:hypothetical protein
MNDGRAVKNALVFNKAAEGLYHFQSGYDDTSWTVKSKLLTLIPISQVIQHQHQNYKHLEESITFSLMVQVILQFLIQLNLRQMVQRVQ